MGWKIKAWRQKMCLRNGLCPGLSVLSYNICQTMQSHGRKALHGFTLHTEHTALPSLLIKLQTGKYMMNTVAVTVMRDHFILMEIHRSNGILRWIHFGMIHVCGVLM